MSTEKNPMKWEEFTFSFRKTVFSLENEKMFFGGVSIRNFSLDKKGSPKRDFTLGFENFAGRNKSAVIPKYERV